MLGRPKPECRLRADSRHQRQLLRINLQYFLPAYPGGKLTTLYTYPEFVVQYPTGVVQASDGNFYMTVSGGNEQNGFILKITPAGKATTLYSFCSLTNCADGSKPGRPLVQGANGNFYGTAGFGGEYGNGTFFELTLAGKLTTLHSFDYETAGNLGSQPSSGVILGANGDFYGVAELGGEVCVNGCGTVFKMTPAGKLTTLHEFTGSPSQGYIPWGIAEATTGILFGDTNQGGPGNIGTVYSVSDGLAAFVELVTNYGPEGETIDVLGQGLTGTTAVSLNGTTASFEAGSDTYLTATVPNGATTGS
jgi:uncharacterized repeat protein (TIGR03803 family)